MNTKIWRLVGGAAAAFTLVGAQVATTTPAHATTPCAIQPYGLIGDYWRSMGAENSWFGCATGVEYSVPNMATGRKQRFKNGQIAWSPDQGPKMIVAAFNKNGVAVFRWGPTNPFNYDYFVVDFGSGTPEVRKPYRNMPRTQGRAEGHARVKYSFSVRGCDKNLIGRTCRQGWTIPVSVQGG